MQTHNTYPWIEQDRFVYEERQVCDMSLGQQESFMYRVAARRDEVALHALGLDGGGESSSSSSNSNSGGGGRFDIAAFSRGDYS